MKMFGLSKSQAKADERRLYYLLLYICAVFFKQQIYDKSIFSPYYTEDLLYWC